MKNKWNCGYVMDGMNVIDKQEIYNLFTEGSDKIEFLHKLSDYCDNKGLDEPQKMWVIFHISRDAQSWVQNLWKKQNKEILDKLKVTP